MTKRTTTILVIAAFIALLAVPAIAQTVRDLWRGSATESGKIGLYDGNGYYSTITPGTQAASFDYTAPTDDGSADNEVLTTNGSGVLDWEAIGTVIGTDYIADGLGTEIVANLITADSVAGNESGEQAFVFSGRGSLTLAADYLDVGQTVSVKAGGLFTTDGAESETLQLIADFGGQEVFDTGAVDVSTATTGGAWGYEYTWTQLTAGASGTAIVSGSYWYDVGAAGSAVYIPFTVTVSSFDTTGTNLLATSATWANGDASPDTVSLNQMVVTGIDDA